MKILGITGGVGAGKSTVLDFLKEKYHAYVILADLVGHLVMEPDGICYDSVVALFGKDRKASCRKECRSRWSPYH